MDAFEKSADVAASGSYEHMAYRVSMPGLGNIVVPQAPPSYQPAQTMQRKPAGRVGDKGASGGNGQQVSAENRVASRRPLWMRIVVDAMFVPFIQGFMLNIGTHWVRSWRRSGGLMALFRRSKRTVE